LPKPVKTRNSGQWTEARYNQFIRSALRKARWPVKYEVLKNAQTKKKTNKLTGRLAMHYRCSECKGEFPQKQMAADHIEPVVDPRLGFVDWNTFIDRLFIELDGFQALCKDCHQKKTNKEKDIAKQRKRI